MCIGLQYVVYAIEFQKYPLVYIIEDNSFDSYPFWFPLDMFEIIDYRISKYFHYGYSQVIENVSDIGIVPILTFKEWAEDKYFWNQLFDSDDYTPPEYKEKSKNIDYQDVFNKYKKLMDYEFFNPNLLPQVYDPGNTYKIEQLDGNLVMCWNCEYCWEIETTNEMIDCTRCHNVYVNPLFPELLSKMNLFF